MNEYTPETDQIRDAWRHDRERYTGVNRPNTYGAEFDRWLAAHDREVAAKALRDAAERYNAETHPESDSWNPLTAGSDDFEGILLRYAAPVSEPSTPEQPEGEKQ